ncbi:tetratricopeptide repeat protein [candidate division WOR-3 bacterium]|nr:tetratricopeptide repeat protein [candidate division WOR-3 bacterium]
MVKDDIFKIDISKDNIKEREPLAMGVVFIEMGLVEYAKEELKRAKRSIRDPVRARELLGLLYLETGETDNAIEEFKEAIKIVNDFSFASTRLYYNLAVAYEKIKVFDKALASYEEVYMRDIYHKNVEKKIRQLRKQIV